VIKPEGIEVSGAKSDVEAVTEIQVTLDISDLSEEGETIQSAAIPVNYAGMPVENVRLSANYVDVFAKLYQLKEVALVTEIIGELGEGLGAELNVPETILIKGSKANLEEVTSVSAEPVDITGITGDGAVTLNVVLPEGIELAQGYQKITLGVSIQETSTIVFEYTTDEILLEGLTKGKSVNTEESSLVVTISGRREIIDSLTKDQLKLYIDVADLEVGEQMVKVMVSYEVALHKIAVEPEEISITLVDTE
jgi:YbbR domain-containing protein